MTSTPAIPTPCLATRNAHVRGLETRCGCSTCTRAGAIHRLAWLERRGDLKSYDRLAPLEGTADASRIDALLARAQTISASFDRLLKTTSPVRLQRRAAAPSPSRKAAADAVAVARAHHYITTSERW